MEQFSFSYQKLTKKELPHHIIPLVDAAINATKMAYAPYSGFKVGAAAILSNGEIKTGANHENASYPAGICAERALLAGIDYSDGDQSVTAIAIAYNNGYSEGMVLSPCGICRQVIMELQSIQGNKIAIYMTSPDCNIIHIEDASYLLPFSFGKEHLGVK